MRVCDSCDGECTTCSEEQNLNCESQGAIVPTQDSEYLQKVLPKE